MRGPFGLSLSLEENSIKPLYCGDREIWLDYYQNILREARLLPDFLPEVRFDKNRVTFYNMVSGRDIVSRSKPARNIPKKEWQDLTFRLKNLQAKLDCNDTTADARKFIESFKLPLPTSLEYFRIYKGRLIVLWGFYKENENDLKDLVEVVSPEAQEEIKYNNIMGCLRKILIFLIFILLCLLGFRYIHENYLNSDTTSQKPTSGGGEKEGTTSKGTGPINQEKKDTTSKGTGTVNQSEIDITPIGKENGKLWVAIKAQSENPVIFSVINSKGGAEYNDSFPPGKNQKELLLDEGEYTLRYSTEKTEKSISFRVKSEISLILSNSTENSD